MATTIRYISQKNNLIHTSIWWRWIFRFSEAFQSHFSGHCPFSMSNLTGNAASMISHMSDLAKLKYLGSEYSLLHNAEFSLRVFIIRSVHIFITAWNALIV